LFLKKSLKVAFTKFHLFHKASFSNAFLQIHKPQDFLSTVVNLCLEVLRLLHGIGVATPKESDLF